MELESHIAVNDLRGAKTIHHCSCNSPRLSPSSAFLFIIIIQYSSTTATVVVWVLSTPITIGDHHPMWGVCQVYMYMYCVSACALSQVIGSSWVLYRWEIYPLLVDKSYKNTYLCNVQLWDIMYRKNLPRKVLVYTVLLLKEATF